MGLICPEFNTIRTQIIRSQNKQLRPGITAFEEIPGESEYYKIENGDNFMIFKNPNLIIIQSPFQVKLFNIMKIYLQMVHFILRQNLVIKCSLLEHMLKK